MSKIGLVCLVAMLVAHAVVGCSAHSNVPEDAADVGDVTLMGEGGDVTLDRIPEVMGEAPASDAADSTLPLDTQPADTVSPPVDSALDTARPDTAIDTSMPPSDVGADRCPTFAPGELLRGSLSSVYAIGSDLRRHLFPNDRTFDSWFADFGMVRTVSDSDLVCALLGHDVTVRPGTWLIKITSDPRTYAVTRCNTRRQLINEPIAIALYGVAWAMRVIDIPDVIWADYTDGTVIETAQHPDGTLIQYAGSSQVYVMDGSRRRPVTPAAMTANGFRSEFVITTAIPYTDGTMVTAREPLLADPVCP